MHIIKQEPFSHPLARATHNLDPSLTYIALRFSDSKRPQKSVTYSP